ncbi:hypothetical protein FRC06_004552, partial [Ceratobasidium sp. 370]
LEVGIKEVSEVWGYLRKREFGSGKVIIPPKTPCAMSLMLTYANYIIAPSYVDAAKVIKNRTEIEGFKKAHLRDGVAMEQLRVGNIITEWEAGEMLTQFRKQGEFFMGLAHENISGTSANAALLHYSPTKGPLSVIDVHTPYLNDSDGHYKMERAIRSDRYVPTSPPLALTNSTIVHFGHPSDEQSEGFTCVLKDHIAIDSVVFPQGMTGKQLDVLAGHALWKDGSNCLDSHGFSLDLPLEPGHMITNHFGFYKERSYGVRIRSALVVRRVQIRDQREGDMWLGFERLTCVPIQTKMVKVELLTKDERRWLKEHNQRCRDMLTPYLEENPRALGWIQPERSWRRRL